MSDAAFLAVICGVFFLGGFVKGAIGLGLPTIVMGLLSIVMPPAQAAAMIVIPAIATNIWQMSAGPALLLLAKRLAPMILGIIAGTFATIDLLTGAPLWATAALGAVLALYGLLGLFAPRLEIGLSAERWCSPVVGLVTGLINGATGVFVFPSAPYLNSLRMEREELIQAIGIMAFVCPVTLGVALMVKAQYPTAAAGTGLLALLPALAGMYAGQRLRQRLHPLVFRRWFFAGLIGLGGYMLLRNVL